MLIKKFPNWRKLVHKLKEGPDFGIHGAKYENALRMLDETYTARGHYFVVGQDEKALENQDFYSRLFASINFAVRISAKLERNMRYVDLPSLIIGINDSERILGRHLDVLCTDDSPFITHYNNQEGKRVFTLPVGEDFMKSLGIKTEMVHLSGQELDNVYKRALEFSRRSGRDKRYGNEIGMTYLIEAEVVRRLILKTEGVVQNYLKVKSNTQSRVQEGSQQ
ncbi:hypothetical protein HYZ97_00665 [Candidatus Pacearchaeota archaeon]|nr:hypothetical protein [Candidatus Pacearchaeota archaeon]